MKKIIVVILALVVLFQLNIDAFAADEQLVNLVQYNSETWIEWITNGTFNDSGGMMFLLTSTSNIGKISVEPKSNQEYGLLYEITLNNTSVSARLYLDGYSLGTYDRALSDVGQIGNRKLQFTTGTIGEWPELNIFTGSSEPGTLIKIKNIRMFELNSGSSIKSDFEKMTADQLNSKYEFNKESSGDDVIMLQYIAAQIFFIIGFMIISLVIKLRKKV